MEIEGIPKTDNIYKKFISILLLMFSLTVISIVCLVLIVRGRNEYFYKSIFAKVDLTFDWAYIASIMEGINKIMVGSKYPNPNGNILSLLI